MLDVPFWIKEGMPYTIFYCCLIFKVLFVDTHTKKKKIFFSIFFVYTVLNYFISGLYTEPIVYFLFLLASDSVNYKKFIKSWLITFLFFYTLMIILYFFGLTNDPQYKVGNITRRSMGFMYPTVFGAFTYCIFLAYSILKEKYSPMYCISGLFISISVLLLSRARTAFIIIILTTILFTVFARIKWLSNRKILTCLSLSFPIICLIVFIVAINYNPSNATLMRLNKLLSYRIELENTAFKTIKMGLFGSRFIHAGVPDTEFYSTGKPYFFIDSFYPYIAFRFGLIALFLLILGYTKVSLSYAKKNLWKLPVLLFIMSLACISEDRLYDFGFNPFMIFLAITLYGDYEDKNEIKGILK